MLARQHEWNDLQVLVVSSNVTAWFVFVYTTIYGTHSLTHTVLPSYTKNTDNICKSLLLCIYYIVSIDCFLLFLLLQ